MDHVIGSKQAQAEVLGQLSAQDSGADVKS